MKKHYLILIVTCILVACKDNKKEISKEKPSAFEEGLMMHYQWITNKHDTVTILVAAVKDTSYHSKGLKLIGSYRKQYEMPHDINGIFFPDSGYQFELNDEQGQSLGTAVMKESAPDEFEIESTSSNKKVTHSKAYNITPAQPKIYIRRSYAENCENADSVRKLLIGSPKTEVFQYDTLCSSANIFWPEMISKNNEDTEMLQGFLYSKEVLKYPFSPQFFTYENIYESNVPLEISENYICIKCEAYLYTGGAHGTPATSYTNIDLKNKRELYLYDVVDTTKKAELTSIAKPLFEKTNGEIAGHFNFPNNQFYLPGNVGILSDGLIFQYEAYEIASYAQGMPSVFVPFNKISHLLKKKR